ncbi:MAG: Rrf2 family transcriptional regulator [Candidatus Omnitrophica bacterium]|nr:Rrf2 family transcriptional regulator [Candidatus Omnitrophota bacterium]
MRINRKVIYGLGCILEVAKAKNRTVTLNELSRLKGISCDYVEQLLIRFKRKGLVKSIRGKKGGYILAKSAQNISLKDIMEAQEKNILDTICFSSKNIKCDVHHCNIKLVWKELKNKIEESLDKIKISDLIRKDRLICK